MHKDQLEKNWNHLKNQIAAKWNKLSAEDLYQIDGMYDKFVAKLVKRYNYTREIAEKEIENWQMNMPQHTSHENKMHNPNKNPQQPHDFKHPNPETKHKEGYNPNDWKDKKRKAG